MEGGQKIVTTALQSTTAKILSRLTDCAFKLKADELKIDFIKSSSLN
jgi:hypothetical protein